MKKFLVIAGALTGLFVLIAVVGAGMNPQHVVKASRLFAVPPERVWTALLSIRQLPLDRSDLRSMESPAERDQVPASIEVLGSPIRIEAPIKRPPVQLVVKTTEPDLAYSGTWTFVLLLEQGGTRLTVVEEATIRSRSLRFIVRTILGEDALVERIFRAVARKLSEAPRTTGGD